jgi:hypothetical protein
MVNAERQKLKSITGIFGERARNLKRISESKSSETDRLDTTIPAGVTVILRKIQIYDGRRTCEQPLVSFDSTFSESRVSKESTAKREPRTASREPRAAKANHCRWHDRIDPSMQQVQHRVAKPNGSELQCGCIGEYMESDRQRKAGSSEKSGCTHQNRRAVDHKGAITTGAH